MVGEALGVVEQSVKARIGACRLSHQGQLPLLPKRYRAPRAGPVQRPRKGEEVIPEVLGRIRGGFVDAHQPVRVEPYLLPRSSLVRFHVADATGDAGQGRLRSKQGPC